MIANEAMRKLAMLITDVYQGAATSGTTTALADTALGSTVDDYYNGGTIFFISTTQAAIANTSAVITDYTNTGRSFAFGTLAATVTAGDTYLATRNVYNRQALYNALNMALTDIGPVTQYNDTLDVADDTEEYSLPSGVSNVVKVEIAGEATEPYEWTTVYQWRENGGKLIFDPGYGTGTAGNPIRVWYNGAHAELSTDAGVINSGVPSMLLIYMAAWHALMSRGQKSLNADPGLALQIKAIEERIKEEQQRFPKRLMHRTPRYNV